MNCPYLNLGDRQMQKSSGSPAILGEIVKLRIN